MMRNLEGIGFMLIVAGRITGRTSGAMIGGVLMVAGFVAFVWGRFR